MSGRSRHLFYCFISNKNSEYYSCAYSSLGKPVINRDTSPVPLKYNPADLINMRAEFATNRQYASLHRSITTPFKFIKDGADILRSLDYLGAGFEEEAFFTIVKYNANRAIYELYYTGRLDFSKKKDNGYDGYIINVVDAGAWGILSQRDDIQVQIPCNQINPKAIKVLFDGITLLAKYFYQPVATETDFSAYHDYVIIPLVQTNTDGDSFGVIVQGQELEVFNQDLDDYMKDHLQVYMFKTSYATSINIQGSFETDITSPFAPVHFRVPFRIEFYFWKSTEHENTGDLPVERRLFTKTYADGLFLVHDKISFSFNQNFDLVEGERLLFVCRVVTTDMSGEPVSLRITPTATNIFISTNTKIVPTTAYAIRPLDLLQQIVLKVTDGLFTIDSEYYEINNKVVATCGDALRGEREAYIQTNFREWYESYDAFDYLAMRVVDSELFVEKWDTVYDENGEILDLGEITDLSLEQDTEHIINSFDIGSPNQDYRHSSGRLEFNTTTKFSIDIKNYKNAASYVPRYRCDCFGIEFLRLDYFAGNSKDNTGDKQVFLVDITDELGEANTLVSNYKIYQVNGAPITPIIISPKDNDNITYPSPRIRGKAPAGQVVKIYVDSVLDGIVIADINGDFDYNLVTILDAYELNVTTGIHKVEATFTDLTGSVAAVTFTILNDITPVSITFPAAGEHIFDRKFTIKGKGQRGQLLDVFFDFYVDLGIVEVDNSCNWEVEPPTVVFHNGSHGIFIKSLGIAQQFFVDEAAVPVITRPTDEYDLYDTTPIVEGAAKPGETVTLYVDYLLPPVATTQADGYGYWMTQITNPMPSGEHTLSTDLVIKQAPLITVGYKLNRPAFDTILGVTDNTVFNVMLSPKRMLLARSSFFAAIMVQNKDKWIKYGGNEKNQALLTIQDDIMVRENEDVLISSLGTEGFLPVKASFKTVVPDTFNSVFNFFNHGGVIRASYQGNELWMLPFGSMGVEDVSNEIQSWSLLLSRRTPLNTLVNLYSQGLTIQLMKNAIHHSDYNSLHFVKYDYHLDPRYHALELYDDWFDARNDRWIHNPKYIQKWQTNDVIRDQIISNGISGTDLRMYSCRDAIQIATLVYNPISPSPIQPTDIVQEAEIDFSMYPEDVYYFVMYANGNPVAISEKVQTKVDWHKTILIESKNTSNLTGFMYSTGIISKLRIEGLVQKWQPNIMITANTDEIGDNQILHSVHSRKRRILLGEASGLPDYLYLKASAFVILDTLLIENVEYVADKENRLQEQDRVLGHPMYYYELDVQLAKNNQGIVFEAAPDADVNSVVITVDAEAFGLGGSQLIDIELKGE